ncbi:MAG: hypothetical protein IJE66_05910 [Akkermansia sp.]|nr:hypothetical protein [Akkermansia sp.]
MKSISRCLICMPLLSVLLTAQPGLAQEKAPTPAPAPAPTPAPAATNAGPQAPAKSTRAENEPKAPELFGVEIPLLDPASDTLSYNGGLFDVGNNAVVRARFEKYLQQNPDESKEARAYRAKMEELLDITQRNARSSSPVGGANMVLIGRGLYEMDSYPPDGGQAGALASAMVSALQVQFANQKRDRENDKLQREINQLVTDTNRLVNYNTGRGGRMPSASGRGNSKNTGSKSSGQVSGGNVRNVHSVRISHNTKTIAGKEATQMKNDAESSTALALAKVNYQSMLAALLLSRRYDHALIGANSYRHIFRDGDTALKLDKESKAAQLFNNATGMPPTVGSIATAASTARREVDQHMEAVANLLKANKLSDATQHLIEAVAVGEYMISVSSFPAESRRRIAEYWGLRRRVLTSLNARDYGTTEEIARKMKSLDADFDDAMIMSYCAARKQQSDLAVRNALKALQAGNEEEFTRQITEAGAIWPRNPRLEEGRAHLQKFDSYDPVKEEFRTLVSRKEFRTIFNEQSRFEVVAVDPELKEQYRDIITLISTIDGLLNQLEVAAQQDRVMGPCMAYEMLLEKREADERYASDPLFSEALNRYALAAHDFVDALNLATDCEKRDELGSALANYYRAQCIYPGSRLAREGVERLTRVILEAEF